MKHLLALSAFAVIAVAGCASQGDAQLAKADCKIAPITTASVAGGKPKQVDRLSQRQAEADLRSSSYRRSRLADPFSNVEEALRDCDRQ